MTINMSTSVHLHGDVRITGHMNKAHAMGNPGVLTIGGEVQVYFDHEDQIDEAIEALRRIREDVREERVAYAAWRKKHGMLAERPKGGTT